MPRSKRDALGLPPRKQKPETETTVHIIESERGWGSKVDEVKKFPSLEEAEAFVTEFNSHNTEETVPDWYMRAEVVR